MAKEKLKKLSSTLSLQDQCLVYLVTNVSKYDSSTLAALPKTLRRELLVNLPVTDICRMESTTFVDGLSMDSLWKEICTNRLPGLFTTEEFRYYKPHLYEGRWKDYYFMVVCSYIFKPEGDVWRSVCRSELVLDLLFAVGHCYRWFSHSRSRESSLHFHYPSIGDCSRPGLVFSGSNPEYLRFKGLLDRGACVDLFQDSCNYRPKLVNILCDDFYESEFFSVESRGTDTLTQFLSDVEELQFFVDVEECHSEEGLLMYGLVSARVLEAVLWNEQPRFNALVIHGGDPQMVSSILQPFLSVLCDPEGTPNRPSVKTITHKQLKLLEIAVGLSRYYSTLQSSDFQKLFHVITSQESLETIRLRCILYNNPHRPDYLSFTSGLTSFIRLSTFRSLIFEEMALAFESAEMMINAFLTSQCSHAQTLTFYYVSIFEGKPSQSVGGPFAIDSVRRKSLHFHSVNLPPQFFSWLFTHPLIELSTLEIDNMISRTQFVRVVTNYAYNEAGAVPKCEDIVTMIANHPHFAAQNLVLKNLRLSPVSQSQSFEQLLQNRCIEKLSLEDCDISLNAVLVSITQGLSKLTEASNLSTIELASNDLGTVSIPELRSFFEALFSIPHAPELAVDMAHNKFESSHLAVLHEAWRAKCSGRQIKKFTYCSQWCCDHQGRECADLWKIGEIARELSFRHD